MTSRAPSNREGFGAAATIRALPDVSPARAPHRLATLDGAGLVVVGRARSQGLPAAQVPANGAVSETLSEPRERATSLRRSGLAAHASYLEDDPVRELVERSQALDLPVVGSRSDGPADCVLLGEVSGRLVQEASCPVLVTPRAAAGSDPLRGLGAAAIAAPAAVAPDA